MTAVDLVGRLLIIERKDALKYGVDPAADLRVDEEATVQQDNVDVTATNKDPNKEKPVSEEMPVQPEPAQLSERPRLSLLGVIRKLGKSKRALTVMLGSTIYG